jgi:hypothetical protein
MLGDDDLGAALVEVGDDGVAVEYLVADQSVEGETVDEWFDANRILDGFEEGCIRFLTFASAASSSGYKLPRPGGATFATLSRPIATQGTLIF